MTIKTFDGNTESVTSNSQGNLNTVLGAIGTVGALMGGGGLLSGGLGINGSAKSEYATKEQLDLFQQLQAKDILLAQKDSQIALQESENYTDKKLVEVYTALKTSENQLRDELRGYKDAQQAINAQQMAYNASANANISVLQSQIASLQTITRMVVPQSRVCDTGCCCSN